MVKSTRTRSTKKAAKAVRFKAKKSGIRERASCLQPSKPGNWAGRVEVRRWPKPKRMLLLADLVKHRDGLFTVEEQHLLFQLFKGDKAFLEEHFPEQWKKGWAEYKVPGNGNSLVEWKHAFLLQFKTDDELKTFVKESRAGLLSEVFGHAERVKAKVPAGKKSTGSESDSSGSSDNNSSYSNSDEDSDDDSTTLVTPGPTNIKDLLSAPLGVILKSVASPQGLAYLDPQGNLVAGGTVGPPAETEAAFQVIELLEKEEAVVNDAIKKARAKMTELTAKRAHWKPELEAKYRNVDALLRTKLDRMEAIQKQKQAAYAKQAGK